MDFDMVFEKGCQEFMDQFPAGERTFDYFYCYFLNKYGNDPQTRHIVSSYYADQDTLYRKVAASEHPFDLYYPQIHDKLLWEEVTMDSIPMQREDFARMVFDNPMIKEKVLDGHPKVIYVGIMPGLGERGNRFRVVDSYERMAYVAKHYQGEFEREVMRTFSGSLGPQIYSDGNHSFFEELMANMRIPYIPQADYISLPHLAPDIAGTVVGKIFASLHSCNVIYDAWNWTDEVRVKIDEKGATPKILDFGSSYIWPRVDELSFRKYHEKSFADLVKEEIERIHTGLGNVFSDTDLETASAQFNRIYQLEFPNCVRAFAKVRESLAGTGA